MTARAHNLDEYSKTLEKTLIESEEYDHERIFQEADNFIGSESNRSKALLPCRPVFIRDERIATANWPMINLRAKEAENTAIMFRRQKAEID